MTAGPREEQQPRERASPLTIGILALQGGWMEHAHCLQRLSTPQAPVRVRLIRRAGDLGIGSGEEGKEGQAPIDGLVLPGGESTTISRLLDRELYLALQAHARTRPIWGTCAGLILLASPVVEEAAEEGELVQPSSSSSSKQTPPILGLGALPGVRIARNAFGSQLHSFQQPLTLHLPTTRTTHEGIPGVFIRAPLILDVDPDQGVEVLARIPAGIVAVQLGDRVLGTAFHPELTADLTLHAYFVEGLVARAAARERERASLAA